MLDCDFESISKADGLKMKTNNEIIEPWPMKLKRNATQDDFNMLLAANTIGSERYVEWESKF